MLVSGLVLAGFAGCFLIGVLGLLRPELFLGGTVTPSGPVVLSDEERALMFTLYGLAFASFAGAVFLFVRGTRALGGLLQPSGRGDED
jgi:hypothetical protein